MTDPTIPTADRRADTLDPQAKEIADIQDARNFPEAETLAVGSEREYWEAVTADASDRLDNAIAETKDFAIDGPDEPLPVRAYIPGDDGPYPVVVFYHGGGFYWGSIDTHDNVCRAVCERSESLILSVDYRLAPENPFPAALHDAYAALEWAASCIGALSGDSERLAVMGDSAGGTLAAGVSLLARDKAASPDIDRQVLIYPTLDPGQRSEYPSHQENDWPYVSPTPDGNTSPIKRYYLSDEVHRGNIYTAPLLANDLSGLPPATILTAGFDTVRDEGFAYAERLQEARVKTRLENYPAMNHAFVSLLGLVDRANDAVEIVANDLRGAFEAGDTE